MKPDDFKAWRTVMGISQAGAAEALGLSKSTIENYERGTRREDDRPVTIPLSVALACSAIYHRLDPWQPKLHAATRLEAPISPIPTRPRSEVKAEADAKYGGDTEKVATTPLKGVTFEGVYLDSRYNKASEYEAMRRMVLGVEPILRNKIYSIFCDSKANACYLVMLNDCSMNNAQVIGEQLERASGGHNGIQIQPERGSGIDLDPYWPGETFDLPD